MAQQKMSMQSRTRTDNQRYGAKGERLVAGIVPLSADRTKVLLIHSARGQGWVLPKGGWELDEANPTVAATREAWEEGGVIVKIDKDLGQIADERPPTSVTSQAPKVHFFFCEGTVTEEKADWPEKNNRTRQWCGYAQAAQLLAQRPELLEALKRSSIKK